MDGGVGLSAAYAMCTVSSSPPLTSMNQTNVIVISGSYHFKYVCVCELNGYTVVE